MNSTSRSEGLGRSHRSFYAPTSAWLTAGLLLIVAGLYGVESSERIARGDEWGTLAFAIMAECHVCLPLLEIARHRKGAHESAADPTPPRSNTPKVGEVELSLVIVVSPSGSKARSRVRAWTMHPR
jgi:hypothetical protein